jgi:G3E family GTPase
MVLLQSGCLCCTIRGELADAMRDLLSKRDRGLVPAFNRLVIESTGLADPFPVLSTIKSDSVLRHHFRAGKVITTVDAVNGSRQLDTYVESNRQAAIADHLVLTKTEIADAGGIENLIERLRRINPDAPLIAADDADLDAALLLAEEGATRAAASQSSSGFYCEEPVTLAMADGSPHQTAISSFVLTVDAAIDWTVFGIWLTMLINRHGEKILRVKGILNISGEDRPVAIHGVQHLVHAPVHMDAWPSQDRRSHIVFIVDGLDTAKLKASFEAFNLDRLAPALSSGGAQATTPDESVMPPLESPSRKVHFA